MTTTVAEAQGLSDSQKMMIAYAAFASVTSDEIDSAVPALVAGAVSPIFMIRYATAKILAGMNQAMSYGDSLAALEWQILPVGHLVEPAKQEHIEDAVTTVVEDFQEDQYEDADEPDPEPEPDRDSLPARADPLRKPEPKPQQPLPVKVQGTRSVPPKPAPTPPKPVPAKPGPAKPAPKPVPAAIKPAPIARPKKPAPPKPNKSKHADSNPEQKVKKKQPKDLEKAANKMAERLKRLAENEIVDAGLQAWGDSIQDEAIKEDADDFVWIWRADPDACALCQAKDGLRLKTFKSFKKRHNGCKCSPEPLFD